MDAKPSAPPPPGMAPMVQHAVRSTRPVRAVLPPSLSHAAGGPTHMLACAGATTTHVDPVATLGIGREARGQAQRYAGAWAFGC
jgi:hypothetical protein